VNTMKLVVKQVFLVFAAIFFSSVATARQPQFPLSDFFATHAVSGDGLKAIDGRLSALTVAQRDSVIAAKSVLISFFRSTQQPNRALVPFLGAQLASQYPTRRALMDDLLGQEVTVESLTVVNFEINKPQRIDLSYYIVIFAEGNYLLRTDTATLAKEKAGWKIIKVGGIDPATKAPK
jgi:hypothetical protein